MAPASPPVRAQPAPPPVQRIVPKVRLDGTPRQGVALLGQAPAGTQTLLLDGAPVYLAPDGRFIIAFDRDAPPTAILRATLTDGAVGETQLSVGPGNWPIEQVNAALLGGAKTSEEFQRRRADELAQISAARGGRVPSDGWQQPFIWPVKARISGRFGAQRIYRGTPASYQSGVDLAGGAGTTYVAPANGVVVLAADHPFTLEGNLLMIDHGMGLNSAFLHSTRLLVKVGDIVKQGQPIGIIGATGRASGPHLHWSMKWQTARIDPATFVAAPPGS
jgi:murein DD-endopeptidase MepM/ murein hydrolase activator NlpD